VVSGHVQVMVYNGSEWNYVGGPVYSQDTFDFDVTSTANVTFTDVPAWARKITVMWNGVGHNSSSNQTFKVQLGTADGIITTGYKSTCANHSGTVITDTAGFELGNFSSNVNVYGHFLITKMDDNTYVQSGTVRSADTGMRYNAGALNGVTGLITQVYVFTTGGVFNDGTLRLMYE